MMSDDLQPHELTTRQEEILSLIVRTYTQSPEPVSSKQIVDQAALNISSATVRAEMARLEEMGYLDSPHTSAGRVPTALGYRYVVRGLLNSSHTHGLTTAERNHITARINDLPNILEHWMRQVATIMARTVQIASLVTPPTTESTRFKHLELVSIQGRLALLVLVLQGGIVQQRMLSLAEPVAQSSLSEIATRINTLCGGLNSNQMRMKSRQLGSYLEREVVDIASDLIDQASQQSVRIVYQDGLTDIINSFPDAEGAQQAVRVFEERAFLDFILTEVLQPLLHDSDDENVQVIIAGDNRWQELSRLSMVLSRYGIPGRMSGTLGVIGPTNIDYGRAISTVRHVSGLMTDRLADLYANDDDPNDTHKHNDKDTPPATSTAPDTRT